MTTKGYKQKLEIDAHYVLHVVTILCEIHKNNFLSFNNVTYISSTIIYSYEKNRFPMFNIKTINCGPNLFFKSFLLFITDYYSV